MSKLELIRLINEIEELIEVAEDELLKLEYGTLGYIKLRDNLDRSVRRLSLYRLLISKE